MTKKTIKILTIIPALFLLNLCVKADTTGDTAKYFNITKVSDEQTFSYFPDFTYEKEGISHNFSDNKGKITLINLWATWCAPCKHEIPDLIRLYEEFNKNDFEILGILVADKTENLENFLETNHINYPLINGNDKLISAISGSAGKQINAIPYTIIVDREGRIIETLVGTRTYEEFKTIINKYLN